MSSNKDINVPEIKEQLGSFHPINKMKDHILNLLESFNFEIIEGPEVETESFNFDMLNIKKNSSSKTNA